MRALNSIALILVCIGALNWLLISLFSYDLVASLFAAGYGTVSVASRIIYLLIGLSGVWLLFSLLPEVLSRRAFAPARAMS